MQENNTGRDESLRPTPEVIEGARQALTPDYVADLEAKLAELEAQLAKATEDRDNWFKWCTKSDAIIYKAKEQIENAIANGDITEDELEEPFWTELFATLGVESHEVVEIDVVATWSVSVTKPRGRKLHETDFTAELQLESSELEFDGWVRSPEIDFTEN